MTLDLVILQLHLKLDRKRCINYHRFHSGQFSDRVPAQFVDQWSFGILINNLIATSVLSSTLTCLSLIKSTLHPNFVIFISETSVEFTLFANFPFQALNTSLQHCFPSLISYSLDSLPGFYFHCSHTLCHTIEWQLVVDRGLRKFIIMILRLFGTCMFSLY